MKKQEIKKNFKEFVPNETNWPEYKNPYSFTRQFEKCSVLIYEDELYSGNSVAITLKKEKDNAQLESSPY